MYRIAGNFREAIFSCFSDMPWDLLNHAYMCMMCYTRLLYNRVLCGNSVHAWLYTVYLMLVLENRKRISFVHCLV